MDLTFPIDTKCLFAKVNQGLLDNCKPFSCGESDLDDFFYHDTIAYEKDLMGKTYCWVLADEISRVVGYVTLANAGMRQKNFWKVILIQLCLFLIVSKVRKN